MQRLLLQCAVLALATVLVSAQSGRGRPPTAPPRKPIPRPGAPAPAPPGVAEGGRLARQDVDGATTRYLLRNGLTVIIRERHAQPLAALTAYIKAGSLDETDSEGGLAQLTARMLLNGTSKLPPGALDREVSRLGGVFDLDVGYDRTKLRILAPAESIAKAIELQADLLQNASLSASELKKSALETSRAARRYEDQPRAAAVDHLFSNAFTAHRLKRARYGSHASLGALSREQVLAFYKANYQPQNTIISITGDVLSSQTILQIQQLFGGWMKGTSTTAVPIQEPVQDRLRYANLRADIGRTLVTVGYRGSPPAATADGSKERVIMDMLAAVLAVGQGSRLVQVLREGSRLPPEAREKGELGGLITDVSGEYRFWPGAALLLVQLAVDPARIDRAEAEYFREIERFKREVIGEGELKRARFLLEKHFLDVQSRVQEESELLAFYQARFGESRLIDAYLGQLASVTAQEIQQAAARYLNSANATVIEYEPKNAQPRTFTNETFVETMGIFAPTMSQAVKPEEVKSSTALRVFKQGAERGGATEARNVIMSEAPLAVRDFSILRGARAFVREDRSQPRLALAILFQGGRLIEDQATNGMTEMMLRAMLKSTTTRKGDLIVHESESLGGEIKLVNEPDFFGVTLEVLSRNADAVTRLALDIIENPYFEKGELIRERERLLADQAISRDDSTSRAVELMWTSLFPGHPYGLPRLGTPAVIKAVTEEQLTAWHARTIQRQVPMVVIVGDTDGSALVSRIFSDAFKRGELDKSLKVNLPPLISTPQLEAEARDRRQTSQAIGLRTAPAQSNDSHALALLAQFAALRASQSAAASVVVTNETHLASGNFFAQLSTNPETETKSREALVAEFAKIANAPPTGDDFDIVRNAAIGTHAIRLEGHVDRALAYARAVIAGRQAGDVDRQPDLVRAIRLSEVKRVAELVLKANQPGVGVVRGK